MPPKRPPDSLGRPLQPGWRLSADADLRSQYGENFVVLGEAALLLLREDEPPVRDDVVLALRALEGLGIEALVG